MPLTASWRYSRPLPHPGPIMLSNRRRKSRLQPRAPPSAPHNGELRIIAKICHAGRQPDPCAHRLAHHDRESSSNTACSIPESTAPRMHSRCPRQLHLNRSAACRARTGWRCCLLSSPRWARLLARHANRYQARAPSHRLARVKLTRSILRTPPLQHAHVRTVPPPDLAHPRPGARHLPHDPNLLRHRPAAPRPLPHGPNPPPATFCSDPRHLPYTRSLSLRRAHHPHRARCQSMGHGHTLSTRIHRYHYECRRRRGARRVSSELSGAKKAQDRIDDHLPVMAPRLHIREIAIEQSPEGVAVRYPEEAQCSNY